MMQQKIESDSREGPAEQSGNPAPDAALVRVLGRWLLLATMATISMVSGFHRYTRVMGFGFTPEYLNIAHTTAVQGRYAREVDPATAGPGTPAGIIVTEVQREPLYPMALLLVDGLTHDLIKLIKLQVVALIVAAALFGEMARRLGGWRAGIAFFVLLMLCPVPHFYAAVLFPYAFQFLFITIALFFCAKLRADQRWPLLVAGAMLGLAAYERGAYLALPAFVAGALWIARWSVRGSIRERSGLRSRAILGLLIVSTLVQFPWLVRNHRLGVTGMNQMTGYTLGFTYGDLPARPRNVTEREYDALVRAHNSDVGTQMFIWGRTARGQGSFVDNDRLVTHYALHECLTHPRRVLELIWESIRIFPARLCSPSLDFWENKELRPAYYWHTYINNNPAKLADWAVFALGVIGLCITTRRAPVLGAALIATCAYTFLFSTTLITFDPRYRGVVDGILLMCAAVAVAQLIHTLVSRISMQRQT